MDTQDIAKFAVQALGVSETEKQAFPVVGTRAWSAEEIINLCERLSDRYAKVTRMPLLYSALYKVFSGSFNGDGMLLID